MTTDSLLAATAFVVTVWIIWLILVFGFVLLATWLSGRADRRRRTRKDR